MRSKITLGMLSIALLASAALHSTVVAADDFSAVVKLVERFYRVKHQSIPLVARAGMKAAQTAARIKGGDARRLAEAGSVKVAIFEDQNFDSHGAIVDFKTSVMSTLGDGWTPLVQTLMPKEEEQSHIFLRDAGEKFHVLVVTIERRSAVVVQMTLKPGTLAQLLQDPNDMAKELTDDATTNDPE